MLTHPNFNPIAIDFKIFAIRWYGLMYLLGFILFLVLGHLRAKQPWRGMNDRDVDDLLFFGVIGTIVGGRLGHVFFYDPSMIIERPLEIFQVWKGGMASHGGIIGVIVAMWWFAKSRGKQFLSVADFVVPLVPLGLGAGRIGNFINGELWGRVADPRVIPWAMIFPQAHDGLPRHPSQLYEFGLEGLVLFAILWIYTRKPRPVGCAGGLFLMAYGALRILGEFTREPEALYGYMPLGFSAGQWLSLPMIVIGATLFAYSTRHPHVPRAATAAGNP